MQSVDKLQGVFFKPCALTAAACGFTGMQVPMDAVVKYRGGGDVGLFRVSAEGCEVGLTQGLYHMAGHQAPVCWMAGLTQNVTRQWPPPESLLLQSACKGT